MCAVCRFGVPVGSRALFGLRVEDFFFFFLFVTGFDMPGEDE